MDVLDELIQLVKGELSGEIKIGVIPTVAPFILSEFKMILLKNPLKSIFKLVK